MENNNFSRIWYEIHITVRISSPEDLDLFQITCEQLCVKALIIHLHPNSDIATVLQEEVMTTSKYFGDQTGAYVEMERISNGLRNAGLVVIRKKLESEPSHFSAPQFSGDSMPPHAYFESHFGLVLNNALEEKTFRTIAGTHGARISRNPLKVVEGKKVLLVTLRDFVSCFSVFQKNVLSLIEDLKNGGLSFYKEKIEIEFAVFDSNWEHDHFWITG